VPGDAAQSLLKYQSKGIPKERLYLPGPDYVERVVADKARPPAVLRNMQLLFNTGRLAGTGYLSILPVDQGGEHSAGASFAPNPAYFDPDNIVRLAIEGGVMRSPPRSGCWPAWRASMPTRSHSC